MTAARGGKAVCGAGESESDRRRRISRTRRRTPGSLGDGKGRRYITASMP